MIVAFLRNFAVTVLALFALTWFMPGVDMGFPVGTANFSWNIFISRGLPVLLTTTLFLVLMTMFVKPVLRILGAPINFLTLGLFNALISGFMFFLAATFVPGFYIYPMTVLGFELNIFLTYIFVAFMYGIFASVISIMF
ncbi:MAG: phage holin family protein [Pseudomonadales bacterium]|jgi:putative membrane protein|nr:phage holin family protein [Pseudomonadales bacterium]